jgi:hypothetical protein
MVLVLTMDMEKHMSQTLERLAELYYQQFSSGYASLLRPFEAKAVPGQLESELEVSEEYVTLSKEVTAYYKPLVEQLVEAGVLTVTVLQPTPGYAVFEVSSVLPEHKAFLNEGKIVLFCEEEQVNTADGKLVPEFKKRLAKFQSREKSWAHG